MNTKEDLFDLNPPFLRDGVFYTHLEQAKYERDTNYMHQRISFTRSDHNQEGYKIDDVLSPMPPLQSAPVRGRDDIVLHGGRQINIRILVMLIFVISDDKLTSWSLLTSI